MFRWLMIVCVLCPIGAGCNRPEPPARPIVPQVSGTFTVFGLSAPVRVVRDRTGVPHIYAQNRDDLFFAQGFVQAQDRLFQMDLWRRAAQGRLAEVLGPNFAERDAMTRRMQARVDPAADWAHYGPDAQAIARAFTRGINTWVALARTHPPEAFALAGWKPDLWFPDDLLNRTDTFVESRDAIEEVLRARLVAAVGVRGVGALVPGENIGDVPRGLDPATISPIVADAIRSVGAPPFVLSLAKPVVDGGSVRTHEDVPLDVRTFDVPGRQYLVHLHAPGWNVIGATPPWTPGVRAGHNDRAAWTFEPLHADTQDVYVERLNPAKAHQVDDNGRWVDTTVLKDTLRIRGRAEPFPFDREFTPHGVVVAVDRERHLAFVVRWSGVDAGGAADLAGLTLDRAASSADVRDAIAHWRTPPQRVSYTDDRGDGDCAIAGVAPVRRGWSGRLPAPGWSGAYTWTALERPAFVGTTTPLAALARRHPDRADAFVAELRRTTDATRRRALVVNALADALRADGDPASPAVFSHLLGIGASARRRFTIGPLRPTVPRPSPFAIVFDPRDWDRSSAIAAPGESESPDSAHYADLARVWASGGSIALPFSDRAVDANTETTVTLHPRP